MAENDWDGWKLMTNRLGGRIQIVGDDLFVTNTRILKEGIEDELDEVGVFNGKDVFYNSLPIPWRLTPVSVGTFCQRKVGYPST